MRQRRIETITGEVVNRVKELMNGNYSQRKIAETLNISQYTVWCVANGKYDTAKPLQYDRIIKQSYFIHQ